jgi:hypothetical protein
MSKAFGVAFAIALVVIAFAAWRVVDSTKGNHLDPVTKIGKVRVQKVDENESIVILDFSVDNQSDRKLVVRTVDGFLNERDGSSVDGNMVAAKDLANIFRNYPALGDQYNAPFKAWDEVKPRERLDRMVGIRFDVPDSKIAERKNFLLRLEDISGVRVDLTTQ